VTLPRNAQELIHWLEAGSGARWLRLVALCLGIFVISLVVAWKQFHGPPSEITLLRADVGRQLATGGGFTTLVNFPQTAALLQAHGVRFDPAKPYPELHHAPLYSILVAVALYAIPSAPREALLSSIPEPPDGFGGDYLLLVINLLLFWLAAWQCAVLTGRLFSTRAAWVAALSFLVSVPVWQHLVSLDGSLLLMVLSLFSFQLLLHIDQGAETGAPARLLSLFGLGLVCGLLFLAEYSAGAILILFASYVLWRFGGRTRILALSSLLLGALLVSAPWIVRTIQLTGHPVGLASQGFLLKAGDATAEPSSWRASYTAEAPLLSSAKLGNKVLSSVQETLKSRIWAGGALLLSAFFVTSILYRFRNPVVNRVRWLFLISFAWLILIQAACGSGESEAPPVAYLAPLIMVFGAGFFIVLVESSPAVASWPRLAAVGLLTIQSLPLVHDALEPRRIHFHYPPYFPALFNGMRVELERRSPNGRHGIMADVPAGLAWYARQRAWAQPPRLRDFYAITVEQPIAELLLTPKTLDRPFFTELSARPVLPAAILAGPSRFGEWGQIYAGLFTNRLPPEFPLRATQKLADNLYVLIDPALMKRP
jgi:hypothetical protein